MRPPRRRRSPSARASSSSPLRARDERPRDARRVVGSPWISSCGRSSPIAWSSRPSSVEAEVDRSKSCSSVGALFEVQDARGARPRPAIRHARRAPRVRRRASPSAAGIDAAHRHLRGGRLSGRAVHPPPRRRLERRARSIRSSVFGSTIFIRGCSPNAGYARRRRPRRRCRSGEVTRCAGAGPLQGLVEAGRRSVDCPVHATFGY